MRALSDRLASLASPAFVIALVLLVLNDFALKPAFHNALTGKLSDFTGLFALTLFVATLWPRHRWLAGCSIAAAFTFWKTSYSEPLIELLNAFLPFSVGRTVDLTDLIALPMILLALWATPRLTPWPLPRALQMGLAIVAPLAFTATSRIPYVARGTMDTSQAVVNEAVVQGVFDQIAEQHGLRCDPCTPLGEHRFYFHPMNGNVNSLTVAFDEQGRALLFVARAYEREGRRRLRALTADIQAEMAEQFPDIAVIETTTGELYPWVAESTIFVIRVPPAGSADSAKATLSSIVEDVAQVHDLRSDERSGTYYAGDRVGSRPRERALLLAPVFETDTMFTVRVERRGQEFEAVQRALIEDLAMRLDSSFGDDNVTRHVAPAPGSF